MGKAIVCVGDYCSGIPVHVCMSGSSDVFEKGRSMCRNGMGVTRTGDLVSCGFKAISGSSNVFSE
jgi:uncharacterized Zn-binding protein involved in type VI secretion